MIEEYYVFLFFGDLVFCSVVYLFQSNFFEYEYFVAMFELDDCALNTTPISIVHLSIR